MKLHRSLYVRIWSLFAIAALHTGSDVGLVAAADQPNIIYILSDDMGFSDIGCYGGEIETPNLDSLAMGGIRFTQFYNTARCCPTRASLLTGLYPHQAGIGHMMNDRGFDGYRGDLNRNCVTIAEVLRQSGYATHATGKWHVTPFRSNDPDGDKRNWPLQRGFDSFYGTIHGAGNFFNPNSLTRGNRRISPVTDPDYPLSQQIDGEYYYTDAISDHAVAAIRQHAERKSQADSDQQDQPFFLYVAYTAAHWPMHARPRDIAKYQGRYDAGYDAIRDARYRRMIRLGVIDESSTVNWPIPDDWKETEHWEWDKRNMEVYAAMVDSMDQGIGRIMQTLKATGQFENTLICYLQDNGGCAEGYGRGGKDGPRPDGPTFPPRADDHLELDMTPRQTRDGYPVRMGKRVFAGGEDTAIGYGRGWATVSNTPFREYKHWTHEGGISTPMIAHWPAGIEQPGRLESTPGHLIDLMATAVDLSGATYPETFHGGQAIKPMEGKSLRPLMKGQSIGEREIYFEHEGNRAVRSGRSKLVAKGKNGPWELYDIDQDRSEQNDLAAEQPERVKAMAAMWQAYAQRANVLPLDPQKADRVQPAAKKKR